MRLFLAVSPDDGARRALAVVHASLEQSFGDSSAAVRWVAVAAAHLTVHFLGDVGGSHVPVLIEALGANLHIDAFDVALGTPEVSPAHGTPRVVWMPVTMGRDTLARVHDELGARLRRVGQPLESRPFAPHLTIGRVRDRERDRARDLRARIGAARFDPVGWRVDHVTLFRSDLSGPAPVYDVRHTIALKRTT